MAYYPRLLRDWEPDSETWKQFLSRDEYQIPVKTKGVIIRYCWNIEVMYQIELTGYLYTEEEGQRKEKLFKDYKDLGMRVVNEAGKTDWNGVETILERISTEMQEIQNKEGRRRLYINKDVDKQIRKNDDQRRQLRINDVVRMQFGMFDGKGMKINAETLTGEVVTIKNVTPYELVRDVKDQIATRLGRKNPNEIILLHQQEELKDTERLVSYGITDGTTINVLPRVRGEGLLENAKYAWDQAKNMIKRLAAWIPGLFADTTRALTKRELGKISHLIGNGWEILGQTLGIDEVKLDHIKADNKTMAMQILKMLTTWMSDIETEATVGKLYKAMEECSSLTFDKTKIKLILSGAPPDL